MRVLAGPSVQQAGRQGGSHRPRHGDTSWLADRAPHLSEWREDADERRLADGLLTTRGRAGGRSGHGLETPSSASLSLCVSATSPQAPLSLSLTWQLAMSGSISKCTCTQ